MKFTPEELGRAPKSATLEPDSEMEILLESGKYWVYASGREVVWVDGKRIDNKFTPCFGVFDDVLWDEKQAARLYDLPNGKRNLTFNDESCRSLEPTVFAKWRYLEKETVKIFKSVFQYIY